MKIPNIEQFTKFLGRMSKREKIIFYGAAFFVTMTIADRVVIAPVSKKMRSLQTEIEEKERTMKKDLRILAQKDKILSEAAKYAQFLGNIKSEDEQLTSMLKEIETLTNKSLVYLVDMKPAGFKEVESSKRYLVNVNCEGEFEQIVDFLYSIENSSKLLTVIKYQLSPKSRDTNMVVCTMTIAKIVIP